MKWPLPAVVPLSAPRDRLGVLPDELVGVHDAVLRAHTAPPAGAVRVRAIDMDDKEANSRAAECLYTLQKRDECENDYVVTQ